MHRNTAHCFVHRHGRKAMMTGIFACGPSFETRRRKSAAADLRSLNCRSRVNPRSVGAPQDEDIRIRLQRNRVLADHSGAPRSGEPGIQPLLWIRARELSSRAETAASSVMGLAILSL